MDVFYNALLKKAAAFTSRHETCRWDAQSRLKTWGATREQTESIVAYLEKERYIDEARFCKSFASDKFRFNKWGKVKIAQALQIKHIPESVYQPVLDAMDEDGYKLLLDELLQKKAREIKASNKYEKQGKLINFALQRGFEYEVVERLLKSKSYETSPDVRDEFHTSLM
jgi:regulatory protein